MNPLRFISVFGPSDADSLALEFSLAKDQNKHRLFADPADSSFVILETGSLFFDVLATALYIQYAVARALSSLTILCDS